ncbi:hypothetical protein Ciccas_007031 [Cichlidogyrus casuarinus]|uniref:Mesencephalic astrocyte-derived neurotrophic factor homolog n=1 Tax=Cichlidogyrus casuarinus TaxID=1844966 RepID=A0ABD2Q5B8_9PLAT
MLTKFNNQLDSQSRKDANSIGNSFKEFCKTTKGKDNSLCYYIGGLETSATNIINEMTRPLSFNMPIEKVCEKLKKMDGQICELKYEKIIDLKTANLKKLKVKDLKKVLEAWGESCNGCTEKNEFISLVRDKMKIYDPEAYAIHAKHEEL